MLNLNPVLFRYLGGLRIVKHKLTADAKNVATLLVIVFALFSSKTAIATNNDWVRDAIGQKMMIDLRYYCATPSKSNCRTPMTELPDEVADAISRLNIGGVILFSENLVNRQQISKLTGDLQRASGQQPLFIAVDQEGGRVARLPRAEFEAFSGNMALGAIYSGDSAAGRKLSLDVYRHLAMDLRQVGINVNFAPNVDVNNNADNPVINVRSFSDNPNIVADIGQLAVNAMQSEGVLATLKHFPGHGDTHVDSHSGLPLVTKPLAVINQLERVPFQHIIQTTNKRDHQPAFVMSAHIQYPALDSSLLTTNTGKALIRPATFSHTILTSILRKQIGFEGLVISDALDMGAISQFFTPEQAVKNAFSAGVDVALMPLVIDTPERLAELGRLIDNVKASYESSTVRDNSSFNRRDLFVSSERIARAKQSLSSVLKELPASQHNVTTSVELASQVSEQSIVRTRVNPSAKDFTLTSGALRLLFVMPDSGKCTAMLNGVVLALANQGRKAEPQHYQCYDIEQISTMSVSEIDALLVNADRVIVGDISPSQSSYEMVGVSNANKKRLKQINRATTLNIHQKLFSRAKQTNKPTALISLRTPYQLSSYFAGCAAGNSTKHCLLDWHFSTFAYNVVELSQAERVQRPVIVGPYASPTFDALAKHILGIVKNKAKLPVSVEPI